MKQYAKDPLLSISIALAALGAVQASTGLLSELAHRYPITFGLVMTAISVSTAVLTVIKTYQMQPPPPPRDDGTAGDSQ